MQRDQMDKDFMRGSTLIEEEVRNSGRAFSSCKSDTPPPGEGKRERSLYASILCGLGTFNRAVWRRGPRSPRKVS